MTESTRHGIAPHHIVDHLAAAGVGCGDAVLVCIGDRRTREAVIDNANSAGHAVLVPLVAPDRPGIGDLAVAVGAAAVVTDRSVPLPLHPRALLASTPPPSGAASPPSEDIHGWGVSMHRRWILHPVPQCRAFVWCRIPAGWHVDPSTVGRPPRWAQRRSASGSPGHPGGSL